MLEQLYWLGILSLVVACVSWTVTHEEIFREPRDWMAERCRIAPCWWQRKFWYIWTCEYCFSHYISAAAVGITGFWLLLHDWRGYVWAWLAVVGLAIAFMSAYSHLRVEIHKDRSEAKQLDSRTRRVG